MCFGLFPFCSHRTVKIWFSSCFEEVSFHYHFKVFQVNKKFPFWHAWIIFAVKGKRWKITISGISTLNPSPWTAHRLNNTASISSDTCWRPLMVSTDAWKCPTVTTTSIWYDKGLHRCTLIVCQHIHRLVTLLCICIFILITVLSKPSTFQNVCI